MSVKHITAGKPKTSGRVFIAPLGTTLPTDATTTLAGTYTDLGYVSEDGLTNEDTFETTSIKEWGGKDVLVTKTSTQDNYKFKLLEVLNPEVLKVRFGSANVSVDANTNTTTVTKKGETIGDSVWVFDMAMRDGAFKRIVITQGAISAVSEITYTGSDASGYELTITAIPDSNGVTATEYIYIPA